MKTWGIVVLALAISAIACSSDGVASTAAGQNARPLVLQSNPPTSNWLFPASYQINQPVAGPDKHIWGAGGTVLLRFDPSTLELQQFAAPGDASYVAAGPDGNMWYCFVQSVGKMTPLGVATTYALPSGSGCGGLTSGSDGNIWLRDIGLNQLLRVTPGGQFTAFALPDPSRSLGTIVGSKNGLIWFFDFSRTTFYLANLSTTTGHISEFPMKGATNQHRVVSINSGADGNAYALDTETGKIYRVRPTGAMHSFNVGIGDEEQTNQIDAHTIWISSSVGLWGWSVTTHKLTNYGLPPSPPPGVGPSHPIFGPDQNVWFDKGVYVLRVLSVSPPVASMPVGGSQAFAISELNCSPCSWKSTNSDKAVAKVSPITSGQFTVIGESSGTATITVTDSHGNVVQVMVNVN